MLSRSSFRFGYTPFGTESEHGDNKEKEPGQNVKFIAIANNKQTVIASYAHHSDIDVNSVQNFLKDPSVSLKPYCFYNLSVDQFTWHLVQDSSCFTYILISHISYPTRCAQLCLNELQPLFLTKLGSNSRTVHNDKQNSYSRSLSKILIKMSQKYDDIAKIDVLASVNEKVETVKLQMSENIEKALENCVSLEHMESTTDELFKKAGVFKKVSTNVRNQMWWRNLKFYLIICFIIFIILAIVGGVIAYKVMQHKNANNHNHSGGSNDDAQQYYSAN